jgi:hypothetical protein
MKNSAEKFPRKKRIKNFAGTKMILQKGFQREKIARKIQPKNFRGKKRVKNFSGTKIILQKKISA